MHGVCHAHLSQHVSHGFFLALALVLVGACMRHAGSHDGYWGGRAGEGWGLQEGGQIRVDLMQSRFMPAVTSGTPHAMCCACVTLKSSMRLQQLGLII